MRQKYGPLLNSQTGKIDLETSKFIRPFAKRWRIKSIFQILLLYRSARYQDLVNLTQQVCPIDSICLEQPCGYCNHDSNHIFF